MIKDTAMFRRTLIATAFGLAASTAAHADSFRWQVNGAAGQTNIDVGSNDGDVSQFGLSGRFYLQDVATDNGPLGEAAFIDQASSIGVAGVYTDVDDIVDDLDGDVYSIDGRFVLNRFIIEGAYTRESPAFADIDRFRIGLGYYITDTTTIVATYGTSDVDDSDTIDAGDIDQWTIGGEHLWLLGNDGAGVKIEASYGWIEVDNSDDIDTFNLAGTWYISREIGIGANYGRFDNFGREADRYGLTAEWFVTEGIGLSAAFTHEELDDLDVEVDAFEIGAELRF